MVSVQATYRRHAHRHRRILIDGTPVRIQYVLITNARIKHCMREIASGTVTKDGWFDDDMLNYRVEIECENGELIEDTVQSIIINGSSITLDAPEMDISGFQFEIYKVGITTDLELTVEKVN